VSDCDDFSGTRPYTCECGRRMRTRGVDGRCIACVTPIPVRCERCRRVRFDVPGDWLLAPEGLPGEVLGTCATCGEAKRQAQERAQRQIDRQLLRDRAAGYGPGTGDPFAGF